MNGSQIISLCKDILKFSIQVLQKIEGRTVNQYEMCINYSFQRAIDIFESIIFLTENNKIIDAGALVRVLIENLCQMRYMYLKPKERSDQFLKYDTLIAQSLRHKMIKSNRFNGDKEKIIDELFEPLRELLPVKPRTYRKTAHKRYLTESKKRQKNKVSVRKALRVLLNCVKRNTANIHKMLDLIDRKSVV